MDPRAVRILLDAYWKPSGWRIGEQERCSPADYAYGLAHGVFFEPQRTTHAEVQARLLAVLTHLDRRTVADAFLASLSTRRLDWRSALGSFAVFQHMPAHARVGEHTCDICWAWRDGNVEDLNRLSFERHKWGGVRHYRPEYAAFDLGLFLDAPHPVPQREDIAIFRELLAVIRAVPPATTSAQLQKHFPKTLKSNKSERDVIVATFGFCGILGTAAHPGYSPCFIPLRSISSPDRHFVDMPYPASWWRASDGVNEDRLVEFFGHVLG